MKLREIKKEESYTENIHITLKPKQLKILKKICEKYGVKQSQAIRMLINAYIE